MNTNLFINKTAKVAIYTSPLIGILAITPIFIVKMAPFSVYPRSILSISFIIFVAWLINICIISFVAKFKRRERKFYLVKYLASYVFSTFFILIAMKVRKLFFSVVYSSFEMNLSHSPVASFVMAISLNTIILIILDLIILKEKKTKIEIENAQLRLKNSEAENQQLKQQIHPHFLFNSLNTLKSLINKSPDVAEDYLIKLSELLRVSVSAGNSNIGKIHEELKLCLGYLEIQKIRYGDALQFTIEIPDEISQTGFIPFFSLQLLSENAIKHNILTNELPLQIKIEYNEGSISVSNNLRPKLTTETTTGTGLINLAERYKILSGDEIRIHKTAEEFLVSIKVLRK